MDKNMTTTILLMVWGFTVGLRTTVVSNRRAMLYGT